MPSNSVRVIGAQLFFLPIETRVPLKFGAEVVTSVSCARVALQVRGASGREATGWGETPLSVQWAWPSAAPYDERFTAMLEFCRVLAKAWPNFDSEGHALEVGLDFLEHELPHLLREFNASRAEHLPHLAALVCASAFDIALHDAFGDLHGVPIYETYNADWLSRDLSEFLEPRELFKRKYPADFLVKNPPRKLKAWHLVGGLDALDDGELRGDEPRDGYPVTLREWIARDGLLCLKIKLRGNDAGWDFERIVKVGNIAIEAGVLWLSTDFNCTVREPEYVNAILDRLRDEHPRIFAMLLYVEQPFPYDLEASAMDVHSLSSRKPLFLDESAHDWRLVHLGHELGWNGVALKTCKTQSGALLSLCWARAHGLSIMVQDLTNPMLAQIPHVLLAAHAGTIMGVETNASQFYPAASEIEARVHPGLYSRRDGCVDWSTLRGAGFGYRVEEIGRELPAADLVTETWRILS